MNKDDWWLVDVTEEMQGTPALSVMSYFDELDEDDEVCSLFINDIHATTQIRNAVLISNAPNMLRLLKKLEDKMDAEERSEFKRIYQDWEAGKLNL